jgi:4a-hydroxytetrahydrobiopterin dehydratase
LTRLTPAQVDAQLTSLHGWKREGSFIVKAFEFKRFMDGIAFVRNVALVAEKLGHHPDIHVVWTTVTLRIQTHDEGGLTKLDMELAGEIEKKLAKAARTLMK